MTLIFERLSSDMDKKKFSCGESDLDNYLQKQANQDMKRGFATVIAAYKSSAPKTVIGFYTLCAASIVLTTLPDNIIHKMPRYPHVPAIRLGRLAVHKDIQGQKIGSLLMLDALRRSCRNEMAWAFFLVNAKHERAAHFYKKFYFQPFCKNSLTLWMHRKQAEKLSIF